MYICFHEDLSFIIDKNNSLEKDAEWWWIQARKSSSWTKCTFHSQGCYAVHCIARSSVSPLPQFGRWGMCQKSNPSFFWKLPVSEFATFQWKQFIDELRLKAPTFLRILCEMSSHKQKSLSLQYPGICVAASVLLKAIQSLITLLLFSIHAEKQVCNNAWTQCLSLVCVIKHAWN